MKPRILNTARLSFQLAAALAALLAAPSAFAQGPYYWDNAAGAGFGTAGGAWTSTASLWSTSSTGVGAAPGNIVSTTATALNFGTAANALNTGTITVTGTVNAGNLTYGSLAGNVTLTGGTITLPAAATITVNNSTQTIASVLSGATTSLTKEGADILKLTGDNNAITGGNFIINRGEVQCANGATSTGPDTLGGSNGWTVQLGATSGSNGATLALGNTFSLPNPITVRAGSSGTKTLGITSGSIGSSFTGVITANDNLRVLHDVSGSGSITVNNASNTVASNKTVTFSLATLATLTDSSTWSGAGKLAYSGSGDGTINVTGAKTHIGGSTLGDMSGDGVVLINTSSTGLANAPTNGPFGTGTLTIGGTKVRSKIGSDTTVGNAITFAGNPTFPTIASEKSLIFTGDASLGATRILTVDTGSTVAGKVVEFRGAISGSTFGITKAGTGVLTLSGANTYTGNTTVTGGTLNITGVYTGDALTSSLLLGTTAAKTVVNVSNDMTLFTMNGANIAGSAAVYNQTAGSVTTVGNVATTHVANAGGYGYLNLTGGSYSQTAHRFSITNSSGTAGGAGVVYVGGTGTLDLTGTTSMIIGYAGMPASLTVGPGGTVNRPTAGSFWLTVNANAYGVLNVAGGDFNTAGSGIRVGNGATSGHVGFVNLAKGTLTLGLNGINGITGTNTGSLFSNYAGGTLKAANDLTAVVPVTNATLTSTSTVFGPITNNNNANTAFNTQIGSTSNFDGGLTVDTNNFAVTYTSPLLGATGNGVKQSNLTVTGGSGYIGAPMVQFTGGTGTPAAGYAVISGGAVTGIVITSPGDYTVDPTGVTLTGGGGTGASVALTALTANPIDSGLTKSNAGTLTLTNTNTYAGPTTINGGTLTLSGSGSVNSSSGITVNGSGAKLLQTSSAAISPTVTLTQGTLTGSGTVNTVNVGAGTGGILSNNDGVAGAALTIGTLTFNGLATVNTFNSGTSAPIVTTSLVGSGSASQVTINPSAATWIIGTPYHLISYGGGSIGGAGGFGQFVLGTVTNAPARTTPSLSNTGSSIAMTFSGDTPYWVGDGDGKWNLLSTNNWKLISGGTYTDFLASDAVLFDGNATGTTTVDIDTANVAPSSTTFNNTGKNYILSGSFGISSGALTKDGSGSLTINNANSYAGGTTLSAGTLVLGNANAIGSGPLTITGGSLDSSVADLVNAGANAQSWNGDFAFTGSENLNLGTGAVTMSASRVITVNAKTLTVGGIIGGGAVGLTKAGAGTLNLTGANTYSGGTTINASSGTLQATVTTTVNALGTGAVSVGSGSTLVLNNASTTGTTPISNTFTGDGLLKLQFAADATARNTNMPNVTGFNGTIQLSNLGVTGDKWTAASLGTVAGSLVVDDGSTIFVSTAPASFTGGITLNGAGNSEGRGTIRLGATSLGGNISLASSSTINMDNVAAVLTGDISSGAAGTQTLTLGATASTGGTLSGIIGGGTGTIDLATAVGGTYTLTKANTYTGSTTIAASTALRLGDGTTGNDGTINSTSGVTNNGTLAFNRFGTDTWANAITGTGAVTKLGAGTQTLSGISSLAANNYSGTTNINEGTLIFTTTSPTLTGGLRFGSANTITTAGILDLTSVNATFDGTLVVNTNSATANEIKIGAAQTLTINNNVQIGAAPPAVTGTVTRLNMTGGGAFNVSTAAAGTFNFGANANTALSQDITLDLTALSATTINTTPTGTIRVNSGSGTNTTGTKATMLLPTPVVADTVATSTLTAGSIGVGAGSAFNSLAGQINTLQLGTGLTTLNADNLNVGTGSRDIGQIIFAGAGGDVQIRAADGTSRATAFNVATGGATTATGEASTNNLVDFSGHDADILVTSLNVGNQGRQGIGVTSEFKFGAGSGSIASTLDATNVNIGFRTAVSASVTTVLTNRVILSGGTVTFGNAGASGTGVDIGNNAYTGADAASTIGELNISGGTVTIHNGSSGYAVRLGSNVATGGGTVTASMNLTGGTTTVKGDIVRGATAPRTTSTVLINGGILDMDSNDIGTATEIITLTAESGELKNVATINGTGGLTKTSSGTLLLSGTIAYAGDTTVSEGTLTLSSASGPANANTANDASTVTIASTGATLNLTYTGTDQVDELFIGTSQKAAGVYGHTNSGATNGGLGVGAMDAYFGPGTGTLTVTSGPGGGYSTWQAAQNGGAGTTQTIDLDHDNDGVSNGVEYFLGGNTDTTGFTALPGVTNTSGTLSVTWTKAASYTGTFGTDFFVETSDTLTGTWTNETSGPGNVTFPSANEVKFTFPTPLGSRNFARLKVTGP